MRVSKPTAVIVGWAAILTMGCAGSRRASMSAGANLNHTTINTAFLEQYAATYRFRLGRPTSITITPDEKEVLFLRTGPRSFDGALFSFDVATGKERKLLTAEKLLHGGTEQLSAEEKALRERMRMALSGIASFRLRHDGQKILVPLSGRLFIYDRKTETTKTIDSKAGPAFDPRWSPSGDKIACVRNGDLYVYDVESGAETRLTTKENEHVTYAMAEFVAQEEMNRLHGFWWSPDSKKLLVARSDTSKVEQLHIMDPHDPAKKPESWPYPRPGKTNADVSLFLIDATGGAKTPVPWDVAKFPYLISVRWASQAPLTLVVQNRHQTELTILTADASGKTMVIHTEKDSAWVNVDQDVPRWLSDRGEFLWTTEREGFWQLELRKADGTLIRTLTKPDFGYRSLVHVTKNAAYVRASSNPTEAQLHKVPLDGSAITQLTEASGDHNAVFGRKDTVRVNIVEPAKGAPSWTIVRADGNAAGQLASVGERPDTAPNYELVTAEANGRTHHAAIIRPTNFDGSKKYPVIVHVYGGPWHQMVAATEAKYVFDQWIADHGYVIVSIDGRGTPGRGREWERTIKHNLIEAPLSDQADVLEVLLKTHSELDASRVGIYGWSFGGYFSAMAVMRRPELFHAGIAGAPVAAWEDYDTHYTERYMGLPAENAEGYKDSSVLTHADKLTRPLMIIHGTADDNVYFTHAIKMADSLFRAGKPYDFVPLAGLTHMVPDPVVATRLYTRMLEFFARHLAKPAT